MTRGLWRYFLGGIVVCLQAATAVEPATTTSAQITPVGLRTPAFLDRLSVVRPSRWAATCGDWASSCGDAIAEGCSQAGTGIGSLGGVDVGGWVQLGYHNRLTPNSTARNDNGSFNSHPHRLNVHQGWIYAEKLADGSCGWDWGFRFDGMYGVDAADTQSFGNPPGSYDLNPSFTRGAGYGFALPQAYAELANGNWNIKLGHFFTLIGYEVVAAPDNFFYSHALTMYNTEPFTHTGALVSYSPTDTTTAYFGWTLGWDTGFDNNRGGNAYIGGFSHALTRDLTLTYIATMGNFGARSQGGNGYSHSIVFDYQIDDRWNYVLQSDVLRIWPAGTQDDDIGINNYLLYTVNDKVRVGMRAEWWRNDVASQYAITGGVNYRPLDNIILRPEIRYDWHLPNSRTTFGMDVIWTF